MDDGTLIGTVDDVLAALYTIQEYGPALGLNLNLQKCELFWPKRSEKDWGKFPKEITECLTGTDLLGCPIGNDKEFFTKFILKRVNKIKELISKLPQLEDLHCQFLLLKNCIGMPKFNFALRCVKPNLIQDASKEFDSIMDKATVDLVGNGKITKNARDVLFLPVSLGGVGFSKASQGSQAAYTASIFQSLQLQCNLLNVDENVLTNQYIKFLEEVNNHFDDENKLSLSKFRSIRHPQRFLSAKLNKIFLERIVSNTSWK